MAERDEQLERLLERVIDGQLDALTPDEVERLEAYLNQTPQAAARLADVRPPVEAVADVRQPGEAEWEGVFARVEGAGRDSRGRGAGKDSRTSGVGDSRASDARSRAGGTGRRRILRMWEPVLAAAAVVLLAIVWRVSPGGSAGAWELRLATDVQVEEVEVFGDASSFVSVSEDGPAVIWVLDASGTPELGA